MKDFVYLDTDSISSISAQLFEGNILEIIDEKQNKQVIIQLIIMEVTKKKHLR